MSALHTSTRMLRVEPSTEVHRPEIQGSIEVHSLDAPVPGLDPLSTFKVAMGRAGIDQKQAAIEMGLDESLFSRQLRGDGNLPMKQAGANLPMKFWIEYVALLGAQLGLHVSHFTIEQRAMLVAGDLVQQLARLMTPRRVA